MIQLRQATAGDAAQIKHMVRQERLNPLGIKWQRFWLAVDTAGKITGCAQMKRHRDGSYELASLVVTPDWRGNGVARALIEQLVSTCSGEVFLTCRAGLGVFYRRFGFEVVEFAEMPPYFQRIWRLAALFEVLGPGDEKLAVMRRNYAARSNSS